MLTKTTSTVGAPQTTVFFSRTWSQTGKDWRKGCLRSFCQFSLFPSPRRRNTADPGVVCFCQSNCLNELASFGKDLLNLPSCYSLQAPFLNSIYLDSFDLVIGWVRAFKPIFFKNANVLNFFNCFFRLLLYLPPLPTFLQTSWILTSEKKGPSCPNWGQGGGV